MVLVVGVHSEETLSRFRALPDCRVVFAEEVRAIQPEDLADAAIPFTLRSWSGSLWRTSGVFSPKRLTIALAVRVQSL